MSAWVKEALPDYDVGSSLGCYSWDDSVFGEVLVSPITSDDVAEVYALECRVYSFPWPRVIIADCIDSCYQCWMIKKQGKVIAYGVMMVSTHESHLLNLCVDSDYRRQGYGGYMVQFLSDIAIVANAKRMLLEVRESNDQAINLYRKLGFQQTSRRVNYYPAENDREDALVFTKSL